MGPHYPHQRRLRRHDDSAWIHRRAIALGFTWVEVLIISSIMVMASFLGLQMASQSLSREKLDTAIRRIALGLEHGRLSALRSGRACALTLTEAGDWRSAPQNFLPGCQTPFLQETASAGEAGDLNVIHNLPAAVRFSSNGLILDGGTIRLSTRGTDLIRCLVISLPLGIVRWGVWSQGECKPER